MLVRRCLTVLIACSAGLAAGGCVSHRAYFTPTQTSAVRADGAGVQTRRMVPVEAGAQGLFMHVEGRAFRDAVGQDAAFPTLQVRLWIHNDSSERLELRLSEFVATDEGGSRFGYWRGEYKGYSTGVVLVGPRTRAFTDVYFTLPNEYDVLSPQGMTLHWSLRVGDREYRQTTLFRRAADRAFHDPFAAMPMGSL